MSDAWRETPTLVGRAATLRPLVPGDRDSLLAALNHPQMRLFFTIVPDAATIDAWLVETWRQRDVGRAMPFAVLDANDELVGTTRYMRMAEPHRRLEIGSTLYAPRVQRTALNTEAKRLLLTQAFETMDCQCVQIRTDVMNQRSRRAIERLGARLDGVIRGHRLMPSGYVRDMAVYSILAHEWPGVKLNLDYLASRNET
ncbi:MAG: GNAT family N-acetyltransferase [Sphingomonas sp.]